MQDYLREIEGTLARTNERKSTLLYRLAKRNAEEERLARLGVRSIPTNPLDVMDTRVVKYVLFKLKRDIGDMIARMRNPQLLSIETHGEVVIRAKNDEINHLIAKKNSWERRLVALTGEEYKVASSRKLYFGCAKELPEAQVEMSTAEEVLTGDALDVSEPESLGSQSSEGIASYFKSSYLEQLAASESDDLLCRIEKAAEHSLRLEHGKNNGNLFLKRFNEENSLYVVDVDLLPEEEYRRRILDAKRELLKKRLGTLKK
ncbi:hypothetical protein C3747_15g48 [Trypanosoma cruzi]|uniref:Uncharacterized protein n=2 Tax=Trypanosoma cruzi TaxID=5693 RepID=Q4DU64_TRYCC|nr:hypothetical protein, conserved [Trypanosoma cruzi]EAN96058.1 hypothetical protein, conserved [Trypanosoma cruzi]PWV17924.1 hypothetical protein C3747_15g48 [Trypanosoma cruzi]RNC41410.1 pre-mRNA-splicing factor ISY1 [Trypanosoma cruzi]|eukprot:XP_817909.1 hypothetical protein [Trypanosoma cruzi strain CL Brener]